MKILINCSNLRVGGGLQVAHSFINEIKSNSEHEFLIVVSDFLKYQLTETSFPENFSFEYYTIKPSVFKAFSGIDRFLQNLEHSFQADVVFSVFGPTYWQPKAKHICGFAKPDYIYKDSPFFKKRTWFQKIKHQLMEFVHLFDIKNNNEILITENKSVTELLAQKVTQPVFTVTNYYNQVFENESFWDKSIQLNSDSNSANLLCISANYPHKNLNIIKEVANYLIENFNDFKFHFYLTISREEFGISENDSLNRYITFIGKVTVAQCPYLYHQTNYMFLPTLLECFSATYPEAMYMQKPILTSNLDFAKGICEKAALYFDPEDIEEIANKIVALHLDTNMQKQLIEEGKNQLKKFDTSKERAKKYLEIITSKNAF